MAPSPAFVRFMRYATVGVSTLLLDLGMLYGAVSFLGIPYYIVTPISFLIAVSCNYAISRHFVFHATQRSWRDGYAYFAGFAIIGALATTLLVAGLVTYLALQYLVARVLVACVVGIGNYLFNLYVNFKVAGKHTT